MASSQNATQDIQDAKHLTQSGTDGAGNGGDNGDGDNRSNLYVAGNPTGSERGKAKPSVFVPTLYIAEGLPYAIVNEMSQVFYKTIAVSNTEIAMVASLLKAPWSLKFFWSPLVDIYGTKKRWVVVAQVVLAAICLMVAGSTFVPEAFYITAGFFLIMAVASATQDIAIDGFYLDALSKEQQSFYVGVRGAFYKVAWLIGSGGLVVLAGTLATNPAIGLRAAWAIAFGVCAAAMALFALFHAFALPQPPKVSTAERLTPREFLSVFKTWIDQPSIVAIVLYIFIFRAGDAMMLQIAKLFLLDTPEKHGMNIPVADVGIIYGTVGILFLLVGGIFGSWLVTKFGLVRTLMPTALVQNSAILLYWWLAKYRPSGPVNIAGFDLTAAISGLTSNADLLRWFDGSRFYAIAFNSLEQFSYGLGVAAYTVFLMTTVKNEYRAAHYAIATAIMAFGLLAPGALSGYLSETVGYEQTFLISFFAAIPGMITIFFLPLKKAEKGKK
jgi:Major Facilitator Superfamily.